MNGTWMKNTEIPDDKTRWGSFNELRENTDADVLSILKEAINDPNLDTTADEAKAVQLFQLINDTVARNEQGVKPLIPHLARIDEINSITGIDNIAKRLQTFSLVSNSISKSCPSQTSTAVLLYNLTTCFKWWG